MKYRYFMGVDPGGGIAMIYPNGKIECWVMPESLRSLNDLILFYVTKPHGERTFCMVEKVSLFTIKAKVKCPRCGAMSEQPRLNKGMSDFLKNAGGILGILAAHEITFEEVAPVAWQTVFGLVAQRGHRLPLVQKKNIHKAKAQSLWPEHAKDIGHATADAMLLAEFARMSRR